MGGWPWLVLPGHDPLWLTVAVRRGKLSCYRLCLPRATLSKCRKALDDLRPKLKNGENLRGHFLNLNALYKLLAQCFIVLNLYEVDLAQSFEQYA